MRRIEVTGAEEQAPGVTATIARFTENLVAYGSLLALAALPVANAVARWIGGSGLRSATGYTEHLVLLAAFAAAAITSRDRTHLRISMLGERVPTASAIVGRLAGAAVPTAFAWSALSLLLVGFPPQERVGVVPVRLFVAAMPIFLAVIAVRAAAAPGRYRPAGVLGILLGSWLAAPSILSLLTLVGPLHVASDSTFAKMVTESGAVASVPLAAILAGSALLGTPLFAVLGGIAYLLFAHVGGALEVVPNEGYTMLTDPSIAAIPLFTIAGFFLSESRSGERLVRLLRTLVGRTRGGLVVAALLAMTFFGTFTGASGVTIVALGGLLHAMLVRSGGHSKRSASGMLTAFGSAGLLFPPSLALIIYGSVARVNIAALFAGGLLPGVLMVGAIGAAGIVVAAGHRSPERSAPDEPENRAHAFRRPLARAAADCWGEILLPPAVVICYFSGLTTIVETAAISVVLIAVYEVLIRREIGVREIIRVVAKGVPIIGGVLIVLASARALSYFFVDQGLPQRLAALVGSHVSSRLLFLLSLNLALLLAGAFMDIYSAIAVMAPLVIPLGATFGIDPIHLGILFIANLELGFISPPVGLNLFLASYRFGVPLGTMYRNVVPYAFVQLAVVLLITFVPGMTTWLPGIIRL